MSLLLAIFGLLSFQRLSLREYPDIDPPVVSIDTNYPGAAASVVESRITQIIEDRISGIEGIDTLSSSSEDGRSSISIEFDLSRDIDAAANDVRDRVFGILDDLPVEADPPDIQKVDANEDVIMWLNLASKSMSVPELTDYAERYLVDRFSVLPGVARIQIGGGQRYAMRVWLDRQELAARNLSVLDVENALRRDNVELPAGSIESKALQFTVRVDRSFRTPEQFATLVLGRGTDGYLIRLQDVATVEKGTEEDRTIFRGNGSPMIGIGVVKQSTANTIDVARAAREEAERLSPTLPDNMEILQSYDTSVFIEGAIREVYSTLAIAIVLVSLVIYLFLGSLRAVLIPFLTVPVSVLATFIALAYAGFSLNLLTLLALVLAIGMLVDDAIVVLENIHRRMEDYGESALLASYRGAREVGFAVIATTLVLISVFVPLAFLDGDFGRLFAEFALTLAAAVSFSSFVALTLSPMLASKLLRKEEPSKITRILDSAFDKIQIRYSVWLGRILERPKRMLMLVILTVPVLYIGFQWLPKEYAPREDRGAFFLLVNGPEGASHEFMRQYMDEIEKRLMSYVDSGEVERLLVRSPRGFGSVANFNSGIVINVLSDWGSRRSAWIIMDEIRQNLSDLPGVRAFPVMRQGFGPRTQKPFQFVIGGGSYEQLVEWRDTLVDAIELDNPGLVGLDWDYKETKPQIRVKVDYDRAAELGVGVDEIGRSLETMLGSRRVTTFIEDGEEYDVIVEGKRDLQNSPTSLDNVYVRSNRSDTLIPLANMVTLEEYGDSVTLSRYNRIRSITLEANLAEGVALSDALEKVTRIAEQILPDEVVIDYKGQSKDLQESSGAIVFVFILGILTVFFVLAAQFESWIHPFIILLSVPLSLIGGLIGIFLSQDGSLNVYTQVALIVLIGLSAKNGILIVEFANQLRDRGYEFMDAIREASIIRLRPIMMTSITTVAGSVPLLLAFGAGAETRRAIGAVIFCGVGLSIVVTLLVIPACYALFAKETASPEAVSQRLQQEIDSAERKEG
jgi:multidrug efflux pump